MSIGLLLGGCDDGTLPGFDAALPDAGPRPDGGGASLLCDDGEQNGNETSVDCGGDCSPCIDGERCLANEDCLSGVCNRSFCLVASCRDGVRNGDETGVDCGGECGLCGGGQPCTSNAQCRSGRCRMDVCTMSSCDDGSMNDDETDVDCGGAVCDGCPADYHCLRGPDCESLICAPTGMGDERLCTFASCNDGVQNQDEVSLDCGGSSCPPCRPGLACRIDADCVSLRCVDGGCVSCSDRIRNGDETDIDCGGAVCAGCRDQRMCATGADCESGICEAGLCISCVDGVSNGSETGIDCGGPDCSGCRDGQTCGVPSDCLSNVCAGTVCISCTDGVRNGSEVDVDCGGPDCTGCFDGQMCGGNDDCLLRRCDSMSCTSCLDGLRNGDETAPDCGGALCARCESGLACAIDADCASLRCTGSTCAAPTCADGVRNGSEVAVDCGGTCGACPNGSTCYGSGDCASNVCDLGVCRACTGDPDCLRGSCTAGVCPTTSAEDCASAVPLHPGINRVPWEASRADYFIAPSGCQFSYANDGPDLVFSFTATVTGTVTFAFSKPLSTRWAVVASTSACGTLTPEVGCASEFTAATMSLSIAGMTGTTYYLYLRDTTSGTLPLSNPLEISVVDGTTGFDDPPVVAPPPGATCTPGMGGVVGTSLTRLATGVPSISEYDMDFDGLSPGHVYINGTVALWRVATDGTGAEDVVPLAGITTTPLGYELAIADGDILLFDTVTTGTTARVMRISDDRGATWIPGGEDYVVFPVAPNDDFRGAVGADGLLYMLTHEPTSDSEVWIVPTGAGTVPVTGYLLGTIPFHNCSGLAADARYLYTACSTEGSVVRIDRFTLETIALGSTPTDATHNSVVAHDLSGDGIADVVYVQHGTEAVELVCGLDTPRPASGELTSWGTGTSNYSMTFDPATSTIFAWDDDTRELLQLR
ncbi:MAG: hypothetical protein AB7S26_17225 [Sandaracinaceae bacterium]